MLFSFPKEAGIRKKWTELLFPCQQREESTRVATAGVVFLCCCCCCCVHVDAGECVHPSEWAEDESAARKSAEEKPFSLFKVGVVTKQAIKRVVVNSSSSHRLLHCTDSVRRHHFTQWTGRKTTAGRQSLADGTGLWLPLDCICKVTATKSVVCLEQF